MFIRCTFSSWTVYLMLFVNIWVEQNLFRIAVLIVDLMTSKTMQNFFNFFEQVFLYLVKVILFETKVNCI